MVRVRSRAMSTSGGSQEAPPDPVFDPVPVATVIGSSLPPAPPLPVPVVVAAVVAAPPAPVVAVAVPDEEQASTTRGLERARKRRPDGLIMSGSYALSPAADRR